MKFIELTGVSLSIGNVPEPATASSGVIDLEEIAKSYPEGLLSAFWWDRLVAHLRCSRDQLGLALEARTVSRPPSLALAETWIQQWSWPIIREVVPFPEVKISTPLFYPFADAHLCWRRWHQFGERFVLLSAEEAPMPPSQWLIWRILHESAHLLHLICYPNAGCTLHPEWLVTMEAIAMSAEHHLLRLLTLKAAAGPPSAALISSQSLITELLIGLLERSLRLDFDLAVHLRGADPDQWRAAAVNLTGLPPNRFAFVDEFHGLPGLAAAYMIGIDALNISENKLDVATGSEPLQWSLARPNLSLLEN
jgi:hypothetical protein